MPDETMRAEFEAWAGPEGYPLHRNHKDEADYEYDETKDVWDAWRASRASAAPGGEPVAQVVMRNYENVIHWRVDPESVQEGALLYVVAPSSDAGHRALLRKALSALLSLSADYNGFDDNEEYDNERETIDMLRAAISESEGSSNG